MISYKTDLIFDLPQTGGNRTYFDHERLSSNIEGWYDKALLREEKLDFPDLSEIQVVRHYTNLSTKNFGVENGPYPLGSCTMKYNPKVNEDIVANPAFARQHPLQPDETVQGTLKMLHLHEQQLCAITGMDAFTFQPAAGAHGELTGVMLIAAYHRDRHDDKRQVMLVPDSAHGTNPASAAMAGFVVREVKSTAAGTVDMEDLKSKLGDDVAGMMLTNPNTMGRFETDIKEICDLVHEAGGLMYYDGANFNAILLHVRPGDMGFDCVHLNVHKTFSTPHGGGGPGAGPVGCKDFLACYLPKPVLQEKDGVYSWDYDRPKSIGRMRSYNGSTAVLLRSCAYILAMGAEGLYDASEAAVANANYIFTKVKDHFDHPEGKPMHEFIIAGTRQKDEYGVSTLDMAKGLIENGVHPPTVYFPLIVHEAMMVEPTDTETREGLDQLVEAFINVAEEAKENPEKLLEAPHNTPVRRPDEVKAAKELDLKV